MHQEGVLKMKKIVLTLLLCILVIFSASSSFSVSAKADKQAHPIGIFSSTHDMREVTKLAKTYGVNTQHMRLALIVSEDLNIATLEQALQMPMQDLIHVVNYVNTGKLSDEWVLPSYQLSFLIRSGKLKKLLGGAHHGVALGPQGEVFTWGFGLEGQLANGIFANRLLPENVTSFFDLDEGEMIVDISTGDSHLMALSSNHRVFTWGYNRYGQIGNGTRTNQALPLDITPFLGLEVNEHATLISLSSNHSMVLTSNHRVLSWGWGMRGQIGNGTWYDQILPVDITANFGLQDGEYLVEVVGAWGNIMALSNYKRFFGWGYNYDGSVGDGTRSNRPYPVDVTANLGLEPDETLIQITAGVHHNMLLTSHHRVIAMGWNGRGQIGYLAPYYNPWPICVNPIIPLNQDEFVTWVRASGFQTIVITSQHRVFMWGDNRNGQLGDGTTWTSSYPIDITERYDLNEGEYVEYTANIMRHFATYVFTTENRLFVHGRNQYGLLSLNDTFDRHKPVDATFYESWTLAHQEDLVWGTKIDYSIVNDFNMWYLDKEMTIISDYIHMPAQDLILYGGHD
jgi:alpha-tubulin suppressor-like RCC1 family protein